jgi:hypothetical protein
VVSPKLIALATLLRVSVGDLPFGLNRERVDCGLEGRDKDGDLVRDVCGLEGRDKDGDLVRDVCGLEGRD